MVSFARANSTLCRSYIDCIFVKKYKKNKKFFLIDLHFLRTSLYC